ncbi:MAG TPA: hypothetical protein VLL97_12795 [Acidobacteriota bacterium]|nr:hypothetical protein [Acidobacteriota bacterium]
MRNPAEAAGPAGIQQQTCYRCGAKMNFAPGTSALKCLYCGAEINIVPVESSIVERDYQEFLEKAGREKECTEAPRVKCDKCGAETTMPQESSAGICPFCGANMVFSGMLSRLIKPESLLPFKITKRLRQFVQIHVVHKTLIDRGGSYILIPLYLAISALNFYGLSRKIPPTHSVRSER